ncbi:MAG: hypothetical protein KDK70_31635 [Myxococcales bacterium]|nr:hypothetical protein [Myxococcales bacterium]
MHDMLENDALLVLRAIYDLTDADICPTLDLIERLFHVGPGPCFALITHLRQEGLMQPDRLGLTMRGLAVATALPPAEPEPMAPRVRASQAA